MWAWGGNWHGELGTGTTTGSTVPVQVRGLAGMSRSAAGREHSLAAAR